MLGDYPVEHKRGGSAWVAQDDGAVAAVRVRPPGQLQAAPLLEHADLGVAVVLVADHVLQQAFTDKVPRRPSVDDEVSAVAGMHGRRDGAVGRRGAWSVDAYVGERAELGSADAKRLPLCGRRCV